MRSRSSVLAILVSLTFCSPQTTTPAPLHPLIRDFVGINGHTIQFKPQLYRPVCRLVRDYHPVAWDLGTNTSEPAPFPFAKNRVDWQNVYGSWRENRWDIDVCLMFESIPLKSWQNFESNARAYARSFAREFGPSGKRKLVDSVEIGNEPGNWDDDAYSRLFQSAAQGIREGDPALKILTCNLATGRSSRYEKSVACVSNYPSLFDILNVHTYAQLESWPTWRRSFPEDPKLPKYLQDLESLCRWRDKHAPGKPVWVTEFGYDSSSKLPDKNGPDARWIGVTDSQQAQWLVRSLLVFSAMPIDRAYIYFFDDKDKPSLHASAGITRNFQPKPSYHALAHFQHVLGDYRFDHIVTNQPGRLRIHEYRHGTAPKKSIWVAWSPTGEGKVSSLNLSHSPGRLLNTERMPLSAEPPPQNGNPTILEEINETPLYLFFEDE